MIFRIHNYTIGYSVFFSSSRSLLSLCLVPCLLSISFSLSHTPSLSLSIIFSFPLFPQLILSSFTFCLCLLISVFESIAIRVWEQQIDSKKKYTTHTKSNQMLTVNTISTKRAGERASVCLHNELMMLWTQRGSHKNTRWNRSNKFYVLFTKSMQTTVTWKTMS